MRVTAMARDCTGTRMGTAMTMATVMALRSYFDVAGRRAVEDSMIPAGGVQRQQHCHIVIRIKDVVQRALCDVAHLTDVFSGTACRKRAGVRHTRL